MEKSCKCFHCGLPVPKGSSYQVEINNKSQPMCCIGCQSVAQAIVDNNLTDFYNHRTANSQKPVDLIPAELQVYDNESLQQSFVTTQAGSIREASLILEGIVCAACVWLNEHHVKQLDGVIDFRINYSTRRASLKWDNDKIKLSDVLKAITDIGYNAHPFDPGRLETLQKKEKSLALRRIAVAGVGMMQVMMPAIALYIGEQSDMTESMQQFLRWISLIITIPVVFYSARVFFSAAWRDLKRGVFGMDVPVSLAIGSAFIASVWATLSNTGEVYFDSVVMFTFFLLIGRFLEMGARHKAGQVADELIRLLPDIATRLDIQEDGSEKQTVISASELSLNDHVLIKPGETIPADGVVIRGVSSTNESLLTGESLPLPKKPNDKLIGGTVNVESPLVMRVEKLGDSTTLSSIIRLLDRAQSEKPDLARFADRSAGIFVIILLVIAIAVFVAWWYIDPSKAFWVALSVLVITCPCALSLATPAALTAATGNLTGKGVLTTRGHALETLSKLTHMVFDKTGTLSFGRLNVSDIELIDNKKSPVSHQLDIIKQIAAGLESASEHPLGHAISRLTKKTANVENLKAESGRGVQGDYKGNKYRIGTYSFVSEIFANAKPDIKPEEDPDKAIEQTLTTPVYLADENGLLAIFYCQDELRPEAKQAIEQLMQQGIEVALLSGDGEQAVEAISQQLGIKERKGTLLPADKLAYVQNLQKEGHVVAMVGDGVNDAPVLAAANVSIAMGRGSQLAHANADMILLSENLLHLPETVKLSRRMQNIIHQNFYWAIVYNIIAIPIAAMGWVAPWMAAIGMSMSSLVVVLNALRLKQ